MSEGLMSIEILCANGKAPHYAIVDGECNICIRDAEIDRLKGEVEEWKQKYIQAHVAANGLGRNLGRAKARIAELEGNLQKEMEASNGVCSNYREENHQLRTALEEICEKYQTGAKASVLYCIATEALKDLQLDAKPRAEAEDKLDIIKKVLSPLVGRLFISRERGQLLMDWEKDILELWRTLGWELANATFEALKRGECERCGADKQACDLNRECHGVHLNRVGGE